jgi:hypothetical protein
VVLLVDESTSEHRRALLADDARLSQAAQIEGFVVL